VGQTKKLLTLPMQADGYGHRLAGDNAMPMQPDENLETVS